MYLKKDLLLYTNVYDIVFQSIVYLKKNILYLKCCGYVFSILVVDKTYLINLLGLLIPSWFRFIFIYIIYIYIYIYIYIFVYIYIYICIYILWIIFSASKAFACRQLHIPAWRDFLERVHIFFLRHFVWWTSWNLGEIFYRTSTITGPTNKSSSQQ